MTQESGRSPSTSEPTDGRPIRILLLSNMWPSAGDPVFGGFVSRHVDGLRSSGADVVIIANQDRRRGPAANLRKYVLLVWRSWRRARVRDFDVVCGHFLYPTAIIARFAARCAGVPYVLVAHGTDVRSLTRRGLLAGACRRALDRAALVVAVSESLERTVREDLGLSPCVPSAVVSMGVDTDVFRPDPAARVRIGLGATERVVLFVGNLVLDKGIDVLLTSFHSLLEQGAADRLIIVGAGPLHEALRERVQLVASEEEHRETAESVLFLGTLEHAELATWMAASDVLALPSRREGLGLVLLEAMACGTPCVASKVGGIPELVAPGCGLLVEPEDVSALSAAIATVLAEGKATYGSACRSRALQHTLRGEAHLFLERVRSALGARED